MGTRRTQSGTPAQTGALAEVGPRREAHMFGLPFRGAAHGKWLDEWVVCAIFSARIFPVALLNSHHPLHEAYPFQHRSPR